MRHELCGKLVSNLFSSKTLRERLSKKPVAGILVGLLCGPPIRWNNGVTNSAGSSSVSERVGTASGFLSSQPPEKPLQRCHTGEPRSVGLAMKNNIAQQAVGRSLSKLVGVPQRNMPTSSCELL